MRTKEPLPIDYHFELAECYLCNRKSKTVIVLRGSTCILWHVCEQCARNLVHAFGDSKKENQP